MSRYRHFVLVTRSLLPDVVRRSYALKFGLWFVLLTVIIGAFGLAATSTLADGAQRDANQDVVDLTNQTAKNLENWNDRNHNLNEIIAGNIDENNTYTRIDTNLESESLASMPSYVTSLHYVDRSSNRVLASTVDGNEIGERLDRVAGGADDVGQAWATEENLGFDGGVGISSIYTDNGTTKVAYYRGLDDDRVLVLVANLEASGIGIGAESSDGFVQVVDESGTVAFDELDRRHGADYYGGTQSTVLQSIGGSDSGVNRYSSASPAVENQLGSDSYLVVYTNVEGTDWTVLRHERPGDVYGFVSSVQRLGLLGTIALVLVVGFFAMALSLGTSQSLDRLKRKAKRVEAGDLEVDFSTERIDSLGQLYEAFGEVQRSLREQIRDAREARDEAEQARDEAEQLNAHLERKVEGYSQVMQAVSDGDLTKRMDPQSENEAMSEIAREFNDMIADFETAVVELQNFASEVATASERVNENVDEVDTASRRVTEAIQKISDGAEQQNERFQDVSSEIDGLSSTIEEIASTSSEVADIAHETAETGREGRAAAEEAMESIEEIEDGANNAVTEIERLDEEMEKIDELIEVISQLAHRTNMLALNANIEASRDGADAEEGGDGFSVVAGQIKEFAAESKEAAEDIEESVTEIREQADTAVSEVKGASERIDQNKQSVRDAATALEDVADFAEQTNDGVQEIKESTQYQARSTEEIVPMVEDAETISEQTSMESETAAAAAEEQTAALTSVNKSMSNLAKQAEELKQQLGRFEASAFQRATLSTDD